MTENGYILEGLNTENQAIKKNFQKNEQLLIGDECFSQDSNDTSAKRGTWTSKSEFLLSSIGYAVGLGNVWRFPYLCYRNGGGAFLIPYLTMMVLCAIPLYFLEMGIGQFGSVGCIGAFRITPLLKGTSYAILLVNFIGDSYLSLILAYSMLFFKKIFSATLPWMSCNNIWNTPKCIEIHEVERLNFTSNSTIKFAADEFFHHEILHISTGIEELGGIVWPLFWSLIIVWIVLYFCVCRGIKSMGKVVYFSATFPYLVLIVMFIRGVTLPGAMTGILFYISPDWSRLSDLKVWSDAALQIFFSLGPGWGSLVNMASFNNFRNNIQRDVVIIPVITCATSIFAGFVVFSVLGYLSHQTGIPVETVATNGPGLVFVAYPQAIAMLPVPHLWSALFFIMLFLLAMDTVFVGIDTAAMSILDEVPQLRKYKHMVPIIVCLSEFLVAVVMTTRGGMFILNLLDSYSTSLPVILICIVEIIMVAWIYGIHNFIDDVTFMIGKRPSFVWKYCLKYVTPVILIFILFTSIINSVIVTYNGIEYPQWAIGIGWFMCAISIICIPLYVVYILVAKRGSRLKLLQQYLKPFEWRPVSSRHQLLYQDFKMSVGRSFK